MPHTSANSHLRARVSKDAGGHRSRAAPCFEKHRSAIEFVNWNVPARAVMLLRA